MKICSNPNCIHKGIAQPLSPVINNPIESTDIDNCITLCENCHSVVHQIDVCKYSDLKC